MALHRVPRGIRNNNPLNIRKGNNWQGERQPQTDPAFEEFESLEMGLRAGFIIIFNYMKKRPPINTVSAIISRWAPPIENLTQAYIKTVCEYSSLNPNKLLKRTDKEDLCWLVWGMCKVECGKVISLDSIKYAYDLALHQQLTF